MHGPLAGIYNLSGEEHTTSRVGASSPFHIALLSSKNLRFITLCEP
jgi:hypothetical protein